MSSKAIHRAAKSKAASIERVRQRYYRPGTRERGIKILAEATSAASAQREILALRAEFQQVQAAILPVRSQFEPLKFAFGVILQAKGYDSAKEWGSKSRYWSGVDEIAKLEERASHLTERMIALRPKTLSGIAAVAATIKEDQCHFWKEPEKDRDWDVVLVTRFIDGLIELAQADLADRMPAKEGEAGP